MKKLWYYVKGLITWNTRDVQNESLSLLVLKVIAKVKVLQK